MTSIDPALTISGRPEISGNLRSASDAELSQRIVALGEFSTTKLREEWRRLHRSQPPSLSRDLLIRTIAYRMQELAYGGLSKATRRKLEALAKELKSNGTIEPERPSKLRPGTRLVREWRGKTHSVIVAENQFEYAGKTYSSLTQIAQEITGAHWSGPRFFGLRRNDVEATRSKRNDAGEPE